MADPLGTPPERDQNATSNPARIASPSHQRGTRGKSQESLTSCRHRDNFLLCDRMTVTTTPGGASDELSLNRTRHHVATWRRQIFDN